MRNHNPIGGVMPAMLTPFHPDESLWLERIRDEVNRFVDSGCDGLFVLGSAGEFSLLDEDERFAVAEAAMAAAAGRIAVWLGVSGISTASVVRQAKRAASLRPTGLSAVTPYYIPQRQRDIRAHFLSLAAATDLPLLAYNIPVRTGIPIELDTLATLAQEAPGIVGVKDSSGDLTYLKGCLSIQPERFTVLCGADQLILPALREGAHGMVSAPANIAPALYTSLYATHLRGETAQADALFARILRLCEDTAVAPAPAAIKRATALAGMDCGPARRPLPALTLAEESRVAEAVRQCLRTP